jgi:hypothetical protein
LPLLVGLGRGLPHSRQNHFPKLLADDNSKREIDVSPVTHVNWLGWT